MELADGYRLDAELVVLACGVRPRTGLARAAGLEVRGGIVVDDGLRTSDPRIHAIGDCAEHDGRVYGLAGAALEQADALAAALTGTGGPAYTYTGTRALTRLTLTPGDGAGGLPAAARPWTSPPSGSRPRCPVTTSSASPTPPAGPTDRSSSAATAWSAGSSSANCPPWAPWPAHGRTGPP